SGVREPPRGPCRWTGGGKWEMGSGKWEVQEIRVRQGGAKYGCNLIREDCVINPACAAKHRPRRGSLLPPPYSRLPTRREQPSKNPSLLTTIPPLTGGAPPVVPRSRRGGRAGRRRRFAKPL